jgi:uncharacterized RDD family membrane protein YckC
VPPPPGYAPRAAPSDQLPYASFWIRLVCWIIDNVIVGIALFVFFFVLGIVVGIAAVSTGSEPNTTSTSVSFVANLIYFVLYAGYFIYFWGMGQTPAMRWFGVYVADANTGTAIGFGRAGVRALGYVISVLPCYVGLIWAAFDSRRQGWHDKIATTVVVRGV